MKEKNCIQNEKSSLFSLKNVEFQYKDKEFSIGPINLNIEKGNFISIVGGSGSGKSSMAMLILGLIRPDNGCIMFNGKSTFNSPPVKSSKKIGYVGQDVFMFNDSIKNNIIFGRAFDEKKFNTAIDIAHLDEVINSLPEKENTFVGDSGAKLSGGQIQRVSIARALYETPDFLIFDEATSSLDTNLSNSILKKIQHLKGKITLLQVTHKINETSGSDRVYVMENGKMVQDNFD